MAARNKEYTLGRGKISIARFKTGTQIPDGFRYIGNTPAVAMSISSDNLDHFDSDNGVNEKDDSVTLQTNRTASLTTDNIIPANVALFFFGESEVVAQSAQTNLTEVLADIKLDHGYRLGTTAQNPLGYFGIDPAGFVVSDGGSASAATGTVTLSGAPTAGDTVTIGGQVYTYADTSANPFDVTVGADATASAANLRAAIMAGAGSGTAYGAGTIANSDVTAVASTGTVTLTAKTSGVAGNTIALAKSGSAIAVSGATLTGGSGNVYVEGVDYKLDADYGLLTLLSDGALAGGEDVTVRFSVRASSRERVISGNTQVEGAMIYQANNPKGENVNYYFPYVRIAPDGDYTLKGDTWQEIPLAIEILKPKSGGPAILADGQPAFQ